METHLTLPELVGGGPVEAVAKPYRGDLGIAEMTPVFFTFVVPRRLAIVCAARLLRTREQRSGSGSVFVEWIEMAVLVELHNTGDAAIGSELQAVVEHVLSGRPGEWRVSIVGSRANDDWKMKVEGPNGFERSYTLVGSAGEHKPMAIGNLLRRLLPAKL